MVIILFRHTALSEYAMSRSVKISLWILKLSGAPGEARTPDLMIRSHSLYPTELRARVRPLLCLHYTGEKIGYRGVVPRPYNDGPERN